MDIGLIIFVLIFLVIPFSIAIISLLYQLYSKFSKKGEVEK